MLDLSSSARSPIVQLKEIIGSLPRDHSSNVIDENRRIVSQLGDARHIVPILRRTLADEAALAEVASRSYRHVNLFDKIVLVGNNDPQEYRLTLHLWQPPYTDVEISQELIHEHRFNFWSTILTGAVESEIFEKSATGGVSYRQYRYVPEVGRASTFDDFYHFCGEVRLQKSVQQAKRTGESYYLSAPTIHRIMLPQLDTACTLVLRGARLKNYSFVYNTTYPKESTSFGNSMFSKDDLSMRLAKLASLIETRFH